MENCVFCRIIRGELPSEQVYADANVIAFHDIHPKAPVHVLVVPKEHAAKFSDYPGDESGERKLGSLFAAANRVARQLGLDGYRIVVNVGEKGGQEVFHVHVHIMGGW